MVRSQSPDTPVIMLCESSDQQPIEGVILLREPFAVSALLQELPSLELPEKPVHTDELEIVASTESVFSLAALKRFQRANHLLALLDDRGIRMMSGIAHSQVRKGSEIIVRQGDPGDGFYFVVEGQVRVTLDEKEGEEVARISAGGFFGEMALVNNQPRSASVWTVGETTLLWFDREAFMPFLDEYPTMREVLSGIALQRTEENLWRVLFDDDEVQESLDVISQEADSIHDADTVVMKSPLEAPAHQVEITHVIGHEDDEPETEIAQVVEPLAAEVQPASLPDNDVTGIIDRPPGRERRPLPLGALMAFGVGLFVGAVGVWVAHSPKTTEIPVAAVYETPKPAALPKARALPKPAPAAAIPQPERAPPPAAMPPSDEALDETAAIEETEVAERPADVEELDPQQIADRKEMRRRFFAAYKADRMLEAVKLGRELRRSFDIDWEAHFVLAQSERRAGMQKKAVESYRRFVREFPDNAYVDEAQFFAGELLFKLGRTDEARNLYEAVLGHEQSSRRKDAASRLRSMK